MGKKYKNLINKIADKNNLIKSAIDAKKGNPSSVGGMVFMDYLEANSALLSNQIKKGEYTPGKPKEFIIYEPKRRLITALPFCDRVVQHAIYNVIEPIFEKTFFSQSYGCRKGKGTHAGAIKCQSLMRKLEKKGAVWILKTDFSGYFYNIDRSVLYKRITAKVSCNKTLELLKTFVPDSGKGIPIGNLTSQLFANIYGTMADEWLLHHAKIKNFIRYMDDIVIFGESKSEMIALKNEFELFCFQKMKLKLSHWSVTKSAVGVNFLGYRIRPKYKLLRRQSVISAKKKIKKYIKNNNNEKLRFFLASWIGHAKWADSKNLIINLEKNNELLFLQ